VRLVQEAWQTGQSASLALYHSDLLRRTAAGARLLEQVSSWAEQSYEVGGQILAFAGHTEHPSGILAVVRMKEQRPLEIHQRDRFGLILDGISDPGNAGTILRTAAAAGVGYVAAISGSVDLLSPKVVRAGMGAHFRLPLYQHVSWEEIGRSLPGVPLIATDAQAHQTIYDFRWPKPAALAIGSEAHGLSPLGRLLPRYHVRVPMMRGVESLNAAVAASIVIYSALGPEISSEK
jgi:TrmH family RNA methyltransferase